MRQPIADYDSEMNLSVPAGSAVTSILVDVDLAPKDGSCMIYGITPEGHTECVTVRGGHSQVNLPFAHPKIYVKHIGWLDHVWIGTIGHQ